MNEPPLLVDALPEIGIGLERLLRRKGLDELAATVPSLRIHANEGHLYFVPPSQVKRPPQGPHAPVSDLARWSFMNHPNRQRHWLGTMPRKRWDLVVEVIDGEISVLTVSNAKGELAEKLRDVGRT